MNLLFDAPGAPIVVSGRATEEIAAYLTDIVPGWPVRRSDRQGSEAPDIECARSDGQFVLTVAELDRKIAVAPAFEAAYHLADGLMDLAIARDQSLSGLHAAAARFVEGAVLLLGDRGVGKSTIAVHLAAKKHAVLGDDRLFLGSDANGRPTCRSAGFALMLRLPLPSATEADVKTLAEGRPGVQQDGNLFIPLRSGGASAFGEDLPVATCVWLSRTRQGVPKFTKMSRAEATRAFLDSGWSPCLDNRAFLSRCSDVARAVPMMRLAFGGSAAAAEAISRRFAQGSAGPKEG